MPTRRWMTLTTLATLIMLMLAACSGDDSAASETTTGGLQRPGLATETDATVAASTDTTAAGEALEAATDDTVDTATGGAESPGPEAPAGNGGVDAVIAGPVDIGRDIIFTAELTVAVPDVAEAGSQAARAIERLGGLLFGQQTTGGNRPRTILTFKVFPEDFQKALSELGSIGEIRNQSVSADDVTERIVDLRSRITTSDASVERLRGFLENAQDLETIASLENQLLQRETDLETLRGQLRTLENQVALATIVLTLTEARIEPGILVETSFYPGHDDGGFACPGTAGLTVETGDPITTCFFVTNTGDTPLTDLTLVDSVLGVTIDDLAPVLGDPESVLLPGESLMLSFETVVEGNIRTRTTVTGTPADADGIAMDERPVASTITSTLEAVDPGGITGFSDGLAESWGLLVALGRMALLALAWLLPFSWVLLIAWWLLRRMGRASTPAQTAPAPPEEAEPAKEPTPV